MDFYQDATATIHDLGASLDEVAVRSVEDAAGSRPAALIVPMLYDEITREPFAGIVDGLARSPWMPRVVFALGAAEAAERDRVVRFLADRDLSATVLWVEDPGVAEAFGRLRDRGLDVTGFRGKGLAVWTALALVADDSYAVALHDADIEEYDPRIVARLLLPIVRSDLDFFFAKGYYSRVSEDRLFGRVVRLFVWPFLDAWLASSDRTSLFARYLRSFRYPLAGEVALSTDLAMNVRVPTDWGLEMGILGEVYRNASAKRLCQVDLGVYSHKHQEIGASVGEGLQRMVRDIATTFLRVATETEASIVSPSSLVALRVLYRRTAQDAIRKYAVDATANGFAYDRHVEEAAVDVFAGVIEQAGRDYLKGVSPEPIPDWLRARSADATLAPAIRARAVPTRKERDLVRDAAHEATRRS